MGLRVPHGFVIVNARADKLPQELERHFSLIAGLATDVGSAVSHRAVIAREYGLPAIVNLQVATKMVKTGDLIQLDADRGILRILDSESSQQHD